MKLSIMKRWVKALRSGKYTQARETLKDDIQGGFCCLGVLCDISKKDLKIQWDGASFGKLVKRDDLLPLAVMRWSGVRTSDGDILNTKLIKLNDEDKLSFYEIADVIEKNYKKL